MRRRLRVVYEWLNLHELGTATALSALALGVLVFLQAWDEVHEGELVAVDRAVMLAFREPGNLGDPVGPGWVEDLGRDVTSLGSVSVLTLFTVYVVFYLFLAKKPRAALFVAASVT